MCGGIMLGAITMEHRPEYEYDKETKEWRAWCETPGCMWVRVYMGRGAIVRAVSKHRRAGKDND